MLIHRLQLTHILSFGPQTTEIALEPLNVLIGTNGAGKSNLLRAIELLAADPESARGTEDPTHDLNEWLWHGAGTLGNAVIEAWLAPAPP